MKSKKTTYEIGDIVFVSEYDYNNGKTGENHLFVVIDVDKNEVVPIEYFGMLVSSNINKSKETSQYKYNEPLDKSTTNGLKTDSIVKCDQVYSIPFKNIQFKIGQVDIDDYIRFMNAYNQVLADLEAMLNS